MVVGRVGLLDAAGRQMLGYSNPFVLCELLVWYWYPSWDSSLDHAWVLAATGVEDTM